MDAAALSPIPPAADPDGQIESRQVWARDSRRPGVELVFLHPGQADELRDACHRGWLVCPLPDCPDPTFTTRGKSYRDHFVHVGNAAKHSTETIAHFTAKHMIGQWLRKRHPDCEVVVDEEAVETGQRPDVLATFPDGTRFAFEVQYAGLTHQHWRERHEGYQSAGIIDIWLWGHPRRWLRPPREHRAVGEHVTTGSESPLDRVALERDLLARVDDLAGPVMWVDPERREILTRLKLSGRADTWSSGGAYRHVDIARDDLALCRIEAGRLWTPGRHRDDVVADAARLRADLRRQEAQRLEAERALAEGRKLVQLAEDARSRDAERRAAAKRLQDERLANARAWAHYKKRILAAARPLPPVVEDRLYQDERVGMHPAHWHALVFAAFLNRRVGTTATVRDVIDFVAAKSGDQPSLIERSVRCYLFHLERFAFVAAYKDEAQRTWITVLADADAMPAGIAADGTWQARQAREESTEQAWLTQGG